MTLEDRKKEMYSVNGNITMCQSGCIFESYNKTTKKAKCDCDVQSESTETNVTNINFNKDIIASSFLNTLTNSNFLVLKCYKLVLDFSNFLKNKGRIIMSIILLLFVILLFIYCIKDRKTVSSYIQIILRRKMNDYNYNKNKLKNKFSSKFRIKYSIYI